MTGSKSRAYQLRQHDQRVAGMLADPELVGELLMIGLVWARAVDLEDPPLEGLIQASARAVYGPGQARMLPPVMLLGEAAPRARTSGGGSRRVVDVLRTDIRRYRPDTRRADRCQRPIQGRSKDNELCGRSAQWRRDPFVDPTDGTRHHVGACAQPRCTSWWMRLLAENRQLLEQHPAPEPAANSGGVLARHLDEIDWTSLYGHLDPAWKPPREEQGWPVRPRLQVLIGDGDATDSEAAPAALTLLEGGWR